MDSLQLVHSRIEEIRDGHEFHQHNYNQSERVIGLECMELDIMTQQRYCKLYGERPALSYIR